MNASSGSGRQSDNDLRHCAGKAGRQPPYRAVTSATAPNPDTRAAWRWREEMADDPRRRFGSPFGKRQFCGRGRGRLLFTCTAEPVSKRFPSSANEGRTGRHAINIARINPKKLGWTDLSEKTPVSATVERILSKGNRGEPDSHSHPGRKVHLNTGKIGGRTDRQLFRDQ